MVKAKPLVGRVRQDPRDHLLRTGALNSFLED